MAEPTSIRVNPEEALAFFRAKRLKLDPSFDWRDWKAADHAGAFTVAKSSGFDILDDIYREVERALAEGTTLEDFKKRLTPILQEKGWWGRKEVVDPASGETKMATLGTAKRLATIFHTNLRMAYAAGKWQRIMRVAGRRPWLRYVTVEDERVRLQHRSWHGVTLRWDDPWWDTHFPPNGFNCRCDVQQWSDRDIQRFGYEPFRPGGPTSLPRPHFNTRTNEITMVPQGIQPGFEFNVGKLGLEANAGKRLMDRLAGAPPELAARAGEAAKSFALSGVSYEFVDWARKVIAGTMVEGSLRVVGTLPPGLVRLLQNEGRVIETAAIGIKDEKLKRLARDTKDESRRIPLTDLLRLPQLLANPQAILRDRRDGTIIYVFDASDAEKTGKLVLHLDWQDTLPKDAQGQRLGYVINMVKSAGIVPADELANKQFYEALVGKL